MAHYFPRTAPGTKRRSRVFELRPATLGGSVPSWLRPHSRVVSGASPCQADSTPLHRQLRERLRVAEQQLDVERKRKDTFVVTLAHELRQPLAALLAAVEVIRLSADSTAADRVTAIMRRQIGQMNRVVEDLLDTTRWARGKVSLRKQRLDARDVLRDAALDIATAAAGRGHQLVVVTAADPLWVDADPQRLQQVLANLLRNAVMCTDPGGRISLAAERDGATVTIRVSDTGRGIEQDALTKIFELFSQGRAPEIAGLGIGLSVVREIVTLHDGRIEARSAGAGSGSEFIVTLPLAPSPAISHTATG